VLDTEPEKDLRMRLDTVVMIGGAIYREGL
jgi:hypothetical protein